MIRLLKLCVGLAAFVAFAWFGTTVPLGQHTLFGHLHAISETKESKELVDGAKHAAEPLVDGARKRIAGGGDVTPGSARADGGAIASAPATPAAPQETVSPADKQKLKRLIGKAEQTRAQR